MNFLKIGSKKGRSKNDWKESQERKKGRNFAMNKVHPKKKEKSKKERSFETNIILKERKKERKKALQRIKS